jgi:hypothetical protein
MIPFTSTTTIARGAADIWTTATDVTGHPGWMSVTEARHASWSASARCWSS